MDDLDVGRIDEIRPILANVLFILLGGGKGINYLSNAPENTLFLPYYCHSPHLHIKCDYFWPAS